MIKDRGTGSTLVYQGRDEEYGEQIREYITELYRKNVLVREALTILIMPRYNVLSTPNADRDVEEPDQFLSLKNI